MPIYSVRCSVCGKEDEIYRRIADCDNTPDCCGKPMERYITPTAIIAEFKPYLSMATGQMIDSRTKHRNMLREHGLVEIGDQHKAHQKHLEQRKLEKQKKEREALRREIAARLDSIPT